MAPGKDIFGEVPKWPKGTGCKPAGSAFEGSNPSLSTIFPLCGNMNLRFDISKLRLIEECGSSSVVERQPSKLRVAGSNPVSRSIYGNFRTELIDRSSQFLMIKGAHVAQSVEHILGKDEVTGSIPVMGLLA